MRILYFYQYFTTPKGAWSTRAYEFARRWVAAGHRVTVVTSVYDKSDLEPSGLVDRMEIDGIDVRVVNVRLSNKHGFLTRVLTFLLYAAIGSWYALTVPADVVVASSGPLTVGVPGLVARWLRRRPLVFEVRDLWPEGSIQLGLLRSPVAIRLARALEGACYRSAARVVALSDGMAAFLDRQRGLGERLAVVPNAADWELAERLPDDAETPAWADGHPVAVYGGTLGLIDDCGQLLDLAGALEAAGRGDIQIAVIGDGRERAALEERRQHEGLANLHFLGLRSREEVFKWLRRAVCSLFVVKDVPFLATASPNKLFDAFAVGVPVVQTTQGWMAELIERERCGVTVTAGRPRAMAEAVIRLADDAAYRAELAANARRLGREVFDRDRLAARMLGYLEEAAGVV